MELRASRHYLDAVHAVLSLHRKLRRYSKQLQGENLSGRQLALLRLLRDPGPHTIGTIARYLFICESSVSEMVTKLAKAGLVTRRRSERDQRIVEVEATPQGSRLCRSVPLGGMPLLRERMEELPPPQLRQIHRSLSLLLGLLEDRDA
jgi:DNA-binding MarR family transcriptional regulator